MFTLTVLAFAILVLVYLVKQAFTSNFPSIKHLPSVPFAAPFIGNLYPLGGRLHKNDATMYSEWAQKLGTDVFQCRLGDQRTVVVNSWSAMKALWIDHSNALIDRPAQPEFVDKLGVDVTGTDMTEQIRRCRAAAMRALGKPQWPKFWPLLQPTSVGLTRDIHARKGEPMDIYLHLRNMVFDLALSITYGVRYGEVDEAFMTRFLWSINAVSAVRNSTRTFRHFVPLLRWIPESTSETIKAERVRAEHLDVLYGKFQAKEKRGEVECIVNSLGQDKLSEEEIHGTCVSLLQAAPDTVASGVYQCIGWLSTAAGKETQEEVYQAILEAYGGDQTAAWDNAFREEKAPLLVSLYKETMRFFTIAPFSVPRKTRSSVVFRDAVIPAGVTIIMNSQAINHDQEHFGEDAWSFNPKRYLGNDNPIPHMAFGAGSRICPAVGISNRLTYGILTRLILAFKMEESKGRRPSVHPVNFSDVHNQLVAHPRSFECHFVARDEEWLKSVLL